MNILCLVTALALLPFAAGANSNLMYPELNVTPRASERLSIESKLEQNVDWAGHLPIQVSAATTFAAALQTGSAELDPDLNSDEKKEEEAKQSMASMVGMGVGAFWLGSTIWISTAYRPYKNAGERVAQVKGKSTREDLTRERLAEEELDSLRRLGRTMRWASAATNLIASALMGEVKVDEEESNAKMYANLSALVSLAPLFTRYRWERVADEQEKYKKKIYSPVSFSPLMNEPFTGGRASGVQLVFNF